jgi:hypothetical protein
MCISKSVFLGQAPHTVALDVMECYVDAYLPEVADCLPIDTSVCKYYHDCLLVAV